MNYIVDTAPFLALVLMNKEEVSLKEIYEYEDKVYQKKLGIALSLSSSAIERAMYYYPGYMRKKDSVIYKLRKESNFHEFILNQIPKDVREILEECVNG